MGFAKIVLPLVVMSSVVYAQPEDSLRQCAAALHASQSTLTAAQVHSLIESDLAEGPHPARLRREYLGSGQVALSMTYEVLNLRPRTDRRLIVYMQDIDEDRIWFTVGMLNSDLKESGSRISLYPVPEVGNSSASTKPRTFGVFSGFRHPLTAREASIFFVLVDNALTRLLDGIKKRDVIETTSAPTDSSSSR